MSAARRSRSDRLARLRLNSEQRRGVLARPCPGHGGPGLAVSGIRLAVGQRCKGSSLARRRSALCRAQAANPHPIYNLTRTRKNAGARAVGETRKTGSKCFRWFPLTAGLPGRPRAGTVTREIAASCSESA